EIRLLPEVRLVLPGEEGIGGVRIDRKLELPDPGIRVPEDRNMRRDLAPDCAEEGNLAGGGDANEKLHRAEDNDKGQQDGDEELEPVAARPHANGPRGLMPIVLPRARLLRREDEFNDLALAIEVMAENAECIHRELVF